MDLLFKQEAKLPDLVGVGGLWLWICGCSSRNSSESVKNYRCFVVGVVGGMFCVVQA